MVGNADGSANRILEYGGALHTSAKIPARFHTIAADTFGNWSFFDYCLPLPLIAWALCARTAKVGWTVAAVLGACAATEFALNEGWILEGTKVTLTDSLPPL